MIEDEGAAPSIAAAPVTRPPTFTSTRAKVLLVCASLAACGALPAFKDKEIDSTSFFIDATDPWHFSEIGHATMHDIVSGVVSGGLAVNGAPRHAWSLAQRR